MLTDSALQEFLEGKEEFYTMESIQGDILNLMGFIKNKGYNDWVSEKKIYDTLKKTGKSYSRELFNSAIFFLKENKKIIADSSGPMCMYWVYRPA